MVDEGYDGPESGIQIQMDEMLAALGIFFVRIPDNFWSWLFRYSNAGKMMKEELGHYWGGLPDTLAMQKVNDKYMLCCPVELKSAKGKRHGKQKKWEERGLAFQVSRSPDTNIKIIEQFQRDADIVRGLFEAQALNKECKK